MKEINYEQLEVLSPAGSPECFNACLNAGADAIYLGLTDFNARMKANNFTTENINEFVKLAHLYGTKVYVTLNTLINDDDFDKMIDLVSVLTKAKVDAFIVQDYGVAYALKNVFSDIVLHASTQMGIHNLEGAIVAEKLGFTRIVLSRETKLEDIKEIHEKTNLEIEYFVQGALCVAFSGNCYLSSLEKGESGNEGRCLQLCRLAYSENLTGTTKYLLSARDLSLLNSLEELIDAGVMSFKIEGRMRHSGYTALSTHIYKNAINLIKSKQFNADWIQEQNNHLLCCYSRGSFNSRAYLDAGVPDGIINKDYQNHIGIKIGTVQKVEPFKNNLFKITAKCNHELATGDGLKIIDPKKKVQIASLGVGNVQKIANDIYVFYTKSKFSSGLDIHLTQNANFEQKILNNQRKIEINLKIIANHGKCMEVFATNSMSSAYFCSDYPLEKAKTQPLTKEDFFNQFNKLSDTVFEIGNFDVETDGVFIQKSAVNNARREIFKRIEEEIINFNEKQITAKKVKSLQDVSTTAKLNPKNIIIFDESSEPQCIEPDTIYVYSPNHYLISSVLAMREKYGENFALNLPTILCYQDKKLLSEILSKLPQKTYLFSNNIYGLALASDFKVICSPLMNVKNKYAIKCLNELGSNIICSSIESTVQFANQNNLVAFQCGNFPVMTFAHCPFKTIFENNCKNCKFDANLVYKSSFNQNYKINRTKLNNCEFEMMKNLELDSGKFTLKNLKQ